MQQTQHSLASTCIAVALGMLLVVSASAQAGDSFVSRDGLRFIYRDAPFYFAGTNCYYLGYYSTDLPSHPHRRDKVDDLMDFYKTKGFNVIRVWAFNDGGWNRDGEYYPEEWAYQTTPTSPYNENALVGLDYVLENARQRGLKLILTLTNNWEDYGGKRWYVDHVLGTLAHDDYFYTDPQCRDLFKARIWTILNRQNTINGRKYNEDPTVFAWELMNEPRAVSDYRSANQTFRTWAAEMSSYIRTLAPNHMISTGMEGFYSKTTGNWMYNGYAGTDFIADHQLPNIDFCTGHLYPDHWGINIQQANSFLQSHMNDARNAIGKPYILEEFGRHRNNSDRNSVLQTWTEMVYQDALAGGASAGWNYWMLEAVDSDHQDGFGLFWDDTADRVTIELLASQGAKLNALTAPDYDVNVDGIVDILDLVMVRHNLGKKVGEGAYIRADVNRDGVVNILDLVLVRNMLGLTWP